MKKKIAILGGGNIGKAMARGMLFSGQWQPEDLYVTRRNSGMLEDLSSQGILTGSDNALAVKQADIVVLAVQPQQFESLINDIRSIVDPVRHIIVSVITASTIHEIESELQRNTPVVRVMPNTAISICQSMTCIASKKGNEDFLGIIRKVFDRLGTTLIISEQLMSAATILGACGIAYFLRCIRAASQGGIQVGFHPEQAKLIAAKTAEGAASLLLRSGNHPEDEIDKVTTPRGCTITGLNEMEHFGFSSAFIKGIIASYSEIGKLK